MLLTYLINVTLGMDFNNDPEKHRTMGIAVRQKNMSLMRRVTKSHRTYI